MDVNNWSWDTLVIVTVMTLTVIYECVVRFLPTRRSYSLLTIISGALVKLLHKLHQMLSWLDGFCNVMLDDLTRAVSILPAHSFLRLRVFKVRAALISLGRLTLVTLRIIVMTLTVITTVIDILDKIVDAILGGDYQRGGGFHGEARDSDSSHISTGLAYLQSHVAGRAKAREREVRRRNAGSD